MHKLIMAISGYVKVYALGAVHGYFIGYNSKRFSDSMFHSSNLLVLQCYTAQILYNPDRCT